MDKYEIRRLRLIELMNSRCDGKATEIAKRIDRSESYISRMMYPEGKAGKKRIGEDMAALITQAFGLPPYWLDGETSPVEASPQAREVAKAFDALNSRQQEAVMTMIESYGPTIPRHRQSAPNISRSSTGAISVTTNEEGTQKQSFGSS